MSFYSIRRKELTDIADAIRAKTGKSGDMSVEDMPTEIESIAGGSGGGSVPAFFAEMTYQLPNVVETKVNIGAEVSVTAGKYYTHFLYNGVKLPRIPDSVLASYPYAWIRHNTTSGYYDLLLSSKPFYYGSSPGIYYESNKATSEPWYRVPISSAENATEWENNTSANTYSSWGLDSARTVLWSNHDIPNGSADATEIYFAGSEPVPID